MRFFFFKISPLLKSCVQESQFFDRHTYPLDHLPSNRSLRSFWGVLSHKNNRFLEIFGLELSRTKFELFVGIISTTFSN